MRHIRSALAVVGLLVAATTATAAPSAASDGTAGTTRGGVERISLGDGATLLRGVDSRAELAASCASGKFCGYSSRAGFGLEWGCGSAGIPSSWVGGGWWYNNLSGTYDRVAMYGSRIYTTPHSPSQDSTADWTPVYRLQVCVA